MTGEQLKKSILQHAIEGKLVPQNPEDEPAEALLERIRKEKRKLLKEGKLKKYVESRIYKDEAGKWRERVAGKKQDEEVAVSFELPAGWAWARLETLFAINTGASFRKEQATRDNTLVRVLRGGNILDGAYYFFDNDIFIDRKIIAENILLQKNDLITPSATSIENIGKMARIEKSYDNVTAGGFVFILRLYYQCEELSKYLLYALQSSYFTRQLRATTHKSGQALYNLGKARLVQLLVPIPPLAEQRRIADKLERLEPLIAEFGRLEKELSKIEGELLTKLKKSILKHAIEGKLVPPACRQAGKTLPTSLEPRIEGAECWFTYVIECEDGSFYKGHTSDLLRRYKEHCEGHGAKYTKTHKPKQLFYWEMHYSQEAAIKRELYLKSGSGREWFKNEVVDKPENFEDADALLARIRAEKRKLLKEGKLKKSTESRIYKGEDGKWREHVAGKKQDAEIDVPFELPAGWAWARVGEIFQHNSGKALNSLNSKGNPHQYITTSNVYWGYFNLEKVKTMLFTENELAKCSIKRGDLLVCEGGDVGRAAIWDYDIPMCIQNHIHRLRPYQTVCVKFYYFVFFVYKSLGLITGRGIGIKGLPSTELDKLLLPVPPLAEQRRIAERVEAMLAAIDSASTEEAGQAGEE